MQSLAQEASGCWCGTSSLLWLESGIPESETLRYKNGLTAISGSRPKPCNHIPRLDRPLLSLDPPPSILQKETYLSFTHRVSAWGLTWVSLLHCSL